MELNNETDKFEVPSEKNSDGLSSKRIDNAADAKESGGHRGEGKQRHRSGSERRPRPRPDGQRSVEDRRRRQPSQGERRSRSNGEGNGDSTRAAGGKKKKKRWSRKKKALVISGIIIGILLIVVGVILAMIFHYINLIDYKSDWEYEVYESISQDENDGKYPDSPEDEKKAMEDALRKNLEKNAKEIMSDDDVVNILLIGTDSRGENDRGRSDSMILLSINKKSKKVVMTSFLRDTWVQIPDVGPQRLNAAYAYGGPPLLMKTMQANFGIKIDKYVKINFGSFKQVIDSIGGVDINVTEEELPYINGPSPNSQKLEKAGKYTLNGEQALAYSRIRYVGTDFGRTQRQRTVMDEIFRKAKALSLSELSSFLEKILPNVTTNLERGEIFWLLLKASSYLDYDRYEQSIPNTGSYKNMVIDGMMVLGIDFEKYNKELKESIYG